MAREYRPNRTILPGTFADFGSLANGTGVAVAGYTDGLLDRLHWMFQFGMRFVKHSDTIIGCKSCRLA